VDVVKQLMELWKDEQIQTRLKEQNVSQFYFDGAEHFVSSDTLSRMLSVNYIPTEDDILRSRRKTTGVFYNSIRNGTLSYIITDVGGQRSERKKWVKVVKTADVVLYVVSMSDFDESLWEDITINRMKEALETFDSTVNQEWFQETPIIVVFNKEDLVRKKIQIADTLKKSFPEYTGGTNPDKAIKFIQDQFLNLWKGAPEHIVPITVQLLNTEHVKKAFDILIGMGSTLQKEKKLKKKL